MSARVWNPGEERIRLVPVKVFHAKALIEAIDPTTATNMQFCSEPITLDREIDYLERMTESPNDFLFLIVRLSDKVILGTIGLHEHDKKNRTARLGRWIFNAAERKKSYGAEAVYLLFRYYAFNELCEVERRVPEDDGFPLNKVYVTLFTTNIGGKTYYESLGFKEECVLRQAYFLGGKYLDLVQLCLFRGEWEKLQGGE